MNNGLSDITVRKNTEEARLKAGALQSAIFNSANFSSIATDANGVIQIFNVGAERMLGYTALAVMNKITPADISDPQELIARAKTLSVELGTQIEPGFEALVFKASRGIEHIYELSYIRKDSSRFPAVVSVTALRDDENTIIGYLLIGTDNTARKRVEAERAMLDQALQDKNVELERARLVAGKTTLLYVEDNQANMRLVEKLIARRPDLRLLSAGAGMSGIALARIHQTEVVLMDINLPGINGIQALQILREDPATKHIPVLPLSANAMPHDIKKGLEAGFFHYLTKPIKLNEFMAALDLALEFSKTGFDSAINLGAL